MKAKTLVTLVARFVAVIAFAFSFQKTSAAEQGKSAAYTLQCDMVPVRDVIVQKGQGFKIAGSDSSTLLPFELHAVISWSMPQLDETGRKLVFSGDILSVYLSKMDLSGKTDPTGRVSEDRVTHAPDLDGLHLPHRHSWTPDKRVRVVTTISLDEPQSKNLTVKNSGGGKAIAAVNGFSLETVAFDTDNKHGFIFNVWFDGSFTLDGVKYESNGRFGGNFAIQFGVKTQESKEP